MHAQLALGILDIRIAKMEHLQGRVRAAFSIIA
jgi:hypothetical protein